MARKSWRERRGDGQALTRQPCHPARSARKAGRSRPHRRRRLRPQQAAGVDFWRGDARSPWSIVLLPIACPLRANRSLEPFEDPLIHAMVLSRIGALASFRRLERLIAFHPQLTSDQLPPHLAERLHSSDDEATWNDRDRREPAQGKCQFGWVSASPPGLQFGKRSFCLLRGRAEKRRSGFGL